MLQILSPRDLADTDLVQPLGQNIRIVVAVNVLGPIPHQRTSSSLFAKSLAWSSFMLITLSTPVLLASRNAGTSTTQFSAACFKEPETSSIGGRAEGSFTQHFCKTSQILSVSPNFSESLGLCGRFPSSTTLQINSLFPVPENGDAPVSTYPGSIPSVLVGKTRYKPRRLPYQPHTYRSMARVDSG